MNDRLWPQIKRYRYFAVLVFLPALAMLASNLHAQGNPDQEVIVFANGEKLIGHFESVVDGSAKFKSDTLGEITVDLSKVQEFHTARQFAVIKKGTKLGRGRVDGQIPEGALSVSDQKVQILPANGQPSQTIAVGDVGNMVDEATFQQALHTPGIFEDWKGAVTFGSSIVEATQNSLSFNTTASLIRAVPSEEWLAPRNRTTLNFSDSYGKVTQPGVPTVETSIFHADGERDEYFTPTLYVLGAAAFDHNFSQGLDLQQMYGGGLGWTMIQKPNQTLDLKGSVDYERQSFELAAQDQKLLDSIFSETYKLKFFKNTVVNQQLSVSPAWTNTNAYSAFASVGITLPVYKRFGFNANAIDSFLNDPPPGLEKLSSVHNRPKLHVALAKP